MMISLIDMAFLPTFFDIMSHLPLHLVEELAILGPVHVRWMYPVERNMIARGYLLDETMGFVTGYFHGFDKMRQRVWDADLEDCNEYEVLEGGFDTINLPQPLYVKAYEYIF